MKKLTLSIAALGAALVGPNVAASDDAEFVTIRTTDFRGRPPFTRSVETLPAAEVARLEAERRAEPAVSDELVTVRTVDYRGRPPFGLGVHEVLPIPVDRHVTDADLGARSVERDASATRCPEHASPVRIAAVERGLDQL